MAKRCQRSHLLILRHFTGMIKCRCGSCSLALLHFALIWSCILKTE
ncbi:hypothetical protein T12_11763 [Trichinella patagoniensis]|uniref:Uncharacterized protein n=1 Tax=Trichinella patagoniensis TaxID=990121 RepID=A0A0V0YTS9_9BILA|nr:hypothetical protein T12_11763 [Trichinella patagoniensis]